MSKVKKSHVITSQAQKYSPECNELYKKRCNKCGVVKSIEGFYKDKQNKDGYQKSCCECVKLAQREYYKQNKEKKKEYSRKYYQENKEEVKERNRRYKQENKEKIKKYNREYIRRKKGRQLNVLSQKKIRVQFK